MIIQIEIPDNRLEFVANAFGVYVAEFDTQAEAVAEAKKRILSHLQSVVMNHKKSLAANAVAGVTELYEKQ